MLRGLSVKIVSKPDLKAIFMSYFLPKINSHVTFMRWQFNLLVVLGFTLGFLTGAFTTLRVAPILADSSGAGHYQWTFVSADQYTLSDSSLIEITGSSARLKVRNYSSDANTKFLAHFDDLSGTTVTDSSTGSNHGTLNLPNPTPSVLWTSGKLDGTGTGVGALKLDGSATYISVPDTGNAVSLSDSSSHTLESWVKFNNSFSAGTHPDRQYILDKGEYKMYFDNQTGKLVYEAMPNTTQTWAQKAGGEIGLSWDADGKMSVSSLVKVGSYIYAGTGYSNGDAEVWRFDGTNSWTRIGGNSLYSSWPDNQYDEVTQMVAYGDDLIVGMGNGDGDADLWYYDSSETSWNQIGGDSGSTSAGYSWNTGINMITALAVNGTNLYVGTGNGASEGDLWTCDLSVACTKTTGWTQIGGDSGSASAGYSWNSGYDQVWAIHFIGDRIHVGLGNTTGEAELWACDTSSGCTRTAGWTKIGGDGTLGSWANSAYEAVMTITSYTDTSGDIQLLAGLGASAGDAEVWSCNYTDTSNCTGANAWGGTALVDGNTGSGTAPQSWNNAFERIWKLAVDDQAGSDTLYVALGDSGGDAEVWSCDLASTCNNTAGWTKLGGDGVNSTWTGANYLYVRSMLLDGSTLYAGVYTNSAGLGQLWKYTGSWELVGTQYKYGSWGYNGLDRVMSLSTRAGKLYAGTGSGTGDSTVWEYDGSTWSLVGGQQTNSSWAYNTIETVESLVDYRGDLYAGLGNTTNSDDGQVWKYSGSAWSQIGGHGSGKTGSWVDADNIEAIYSLSSDSSYLYAGLGLSTDDGKVYQYDGTADTWSQIAGRKSPALATGWQDADNIESVLSLISDAGTLYAGLGISAGDGDVWSYNKTAGTWTQIANAGATSAPANGSWWNTHGIEGVYSLAMYNNELYAGLGASTGDAKVYKYDGSAWTQVAGLGADSGYGGWGADYEIVRSLTVYNGYLFAGLSSGDAEGEVWRFDGTSWTQVGGDGLDNNTWLETDNINSVYGLTAFKGKLYAGTGDSNQTETTVWSYGDNLYVESDSAISSPTDWHHYAVVYNGTSASMYIDGSVQTNNDSGTITLENSARPLLVGTSYGSSQTWSGRGFLDAVIDELRVSGTARSPSSFVLAPYSSSAVTLQPVTKRLTTQIDDWSGFTADVSAVGTIKYCISSDNGTTWKYWYNSAWTTTACSSLGESSSVSDINSNISSFPVNSNGILWRAVLSGDGTQQVQINSLRVDGTTDTTPPSDPDTAEARVLNASGDIITGGDTQWYGENRLYFSWDGSTDTGAGVSGYYVYFGLTDSNPDPETDGAFQAGTTYSVTATQSGELHLLIKALDNAGNKSQTTDAFTYKYDGTAPGAPVISVSPEVYTSQNSFSFSWTAISDSDSSLAGYQYAATSSAELADWSSTTTSTSISLTDIAYTSGANRFYVRAIDNAGNATASPSYVTFYYAGSGPGPVNNLAVDDETKSVNEFTFTWNAPDSGSYLGASSELRYCYMVNRQPTAENAAEHCNWTAAGVTAVGPDNFATMQNNTFWVVAKNPDIYGGTIDYANARSQSFSANTSAPGIPLSLEVSDISIKNSSTWRLTVSWAAPSSVGSGISAYKVYRSTNDSTYTYQGSTTGTAYVDTGLSQIEYYYKVKACDDADNCGALSSSVSETPTGKYTTAASLTSGPTAGSITTKKATITWTTDRTCDSKIQFGTSAGSYGSVEPSNSSQVASHTIALTNLSPGTTYYYKAKWTDEDGNTGTSEEKSFTTTAAPTVKDAAIKTAGLTSAYVQFTTTGASSAKIYYGKTTAFGGVATISTSTSESTYTQELTGLEDGTKYYYKINTFDSESAEYEGTILSFSTLPRPKIATVRIQQVKGTAQPTVLVSWETNTEVSSIVTYYPSGKPSDAKDEVNVTLVKGLHRILIKNLQSETPYTLVVKGRDKAGNEAVSDPQKFDTATDTRPALISDLQAEGSIVTNSGNKSDQTAQIVVSWNTDELTTSQVEFGEGSGTTYSQKTQEDTNMTLNHLVIISGLSPSKVYHFRAVSKDKAQNIAYSVDTVTITPKATDDALNLVVGSLQEAFGFLGQIGR